MHLHFYSNSVAWFDYCSQREKYGLISDTGWPGWRNQLCSESCLDWCVSFLQTNRTNEQCVTDIHISLFQRRVYLQSYFLINKAQSTKRRRKSVIFLKKKKTLVPATHRNQWSYHQRFFFCCYCFYLIFFLVCTVKFQTVDISLQHLSLVSWVNWAPLWYFSKNLKLKPCFIKNVLKLTSTQTVERWSQRLRQDLRCCPGYVYHRDICLLPYVINLLLKHEVSPIFLSFIESVLCGVLFQTENPSLHFLRAAFSSWLGSYFFVLQHNHINYNVEQLSICILILWKAN